MQQKHEIRATIVEINRQKEMLKDLELEYEAKKATIADNIRKLQDRCKHPVVDHHPDASGNNDSWDECAICEKEL